MPEHLKEEDLRTDAQKFEDALRKIISTPKKEVEARIAADRARRNQQVSAKMKQKS
jgi:hypothetical protein